MAKTKTREEGYYQYLGNCNALGNGKLTKGKIYYCWMQKTGLLAAYDDDSFLITLAPEFFAKFELPEIKI